MIRHNQLKLYHFKSQALKHVEIIKVSKNNYTVYIIGNVLSWRSQILIITVVRHPLMKLYHHKPQTPKHVDNLKV